MMVITKEEVASKYPLHFLVWEDDARKISEMLTSSQNQVNRDLNLQDERGRTPLMLAIALGRAECVRALVKCKADVTITNSGGWNAVHESVGLGDPEILQIVLEGKDEQRITKRMDVIPEMLKRLKNTPDFFTEMKWEFSSWIPLVSRICPANHYRVYKMGPNLRVDSSVVGFRQDGWQKGDMSMIFHVNNHGVLMSECDHWSKEVYSNWVMMPTDIYGGPSKAAIYEKAVADRMGNPSIISSLDLDNISFERHKSGLFGWGSDKIEKVEGYDCKVFCASNFKLITKIRTEHMCESDKIRTETKSKLERILATFGSTETCDEGIQAGAIVNDAASSAQPVTFEEYFDDTIILGPRDVGPKKEIRTTVNKFKATVWLSEEYPLKFQDQVMPIVDIMALTSNHFTKLRDFILLQIPSGFPVKIEVPIFHLINASITFHNVFALDVPVSGVESSTDENGQPICRLDESLFEPPPGYSVQKFMTQGLASSSEDDLFRWTDGESEPGWIEYPYPTRAERVDVYEALNAPRTLIKANTPDSDDTEEQLLQKAIEESIKSARMETFSDWRAPGTGRPNSAAGRENSESYRRHSGEVTRSTSEEDLAAALEISMRELEESKRQRLDEDDMLQRVLELSLVEQ